MQTLLEHPEALAHLRAHPEAMPGAGEEILRHTSVVQWFARASTDHKALGGGGRHFCLGNRIARLELRVIFTEVLRRMPGLRPAGDAERLGSSWANALTAMPVRR